MRIVIIGNGVSGITVAKLLRTQSPEVEIIVLSEEKEHYYPRPILIEFLAGRVAREEIYFYSPQWYEEKKIQVLPGKKVLEIDLKQKKVITENKEEFPYDFLVVATGAEALIPPIPGFEKKGVFTLRTYRDAEAILGFSQSKKAASPSELVERKKAVVIGGGLLGLEISHALLGAGLDPLVVEYGPHILKKQIDEQGAEILQQKLEAMGMNFRTGAPVEEICGDTQVEGIRLAGGEIIPAALVVMTAGISPNSEISRRAGLKTERGVIVDKYMQTSNEFVFGCGDVAEFEGKVYGIIPACLSQAQIAAFNILNGPKLAYKSTLPNTTLKIAGVDLTCLGLTQSQKEAFEILKRKDEKKGTYKKVFVSGNKVLGVILLGDRKDAYTWNKIITQKVNISRFKESLLEDNFDFSKVFPE